MLVVRALHRRYVWCRERLASGLHTRPQTVDILLDLCAGTMGLKGDLTAGEIVEQLVHAQRVTAIKNVVFMVGWPHSACMFS